MYALEHTPCECHDCTFGTTTGQRIVQVLQMTAQGMTTKEIAAELVVSEASIKRDRTNAFQYLGARTAAHAVALAIREGVIKA